MRLPHSICPGWCVQCQHIETKVQPVAHGGLAFSEERLSDHSLFWDPRYDAVMVTDMPSLRNIPGHQMSNTVDSLDLPFLATVIANLGSRGEQAVRHPQSEEKGLLQTSPV